MLLFLVQVSYAQDAEGIYLTLEDVENNKVSIEGTFVKKSGSKVIFFIDGEEIKYKFERHCRVCNEKIRFKH